MEIIAAILGGLIAATLTVIIMGIMSSYAIDRETEIIRKKWEEDIEEEQAKCNRYRETLDGFIERHKALKEKLSEKDKEIAKLTYHLKTVENVSKERLPKGHTNMFMGMPYDLITDKASDQYALQQECITVKSTGIRMYDAGETGYYCVALGGAYGTDIGDTWHVTLKNGSEFYIILADYKHPIDNPDPNDFGDSCVNYISDDFCTNVIEFIYDKEHIPTKVMNTGTFSALDFFGGLTGDGGDIMKMEYLGRVWSR